MAVKYFDDFPHILKEFIHLCFARLAKSRFKIKQGKVLWSIQADTLLVLSSLFDSVYNKSTNVKSSTRKKKKIVEKTREFWTYGALIIVVY